MKASSSSLDNIGVGGGKKRKKLDEQLVIFDLELFTPTKKKYPCFNYRKIRKEYLV